MKRPTRYRVVVLTSCHKVASIKLYQYPETQSRIRYRCLFNVELGLAAKDQMKEACTKSEPGRSDRPKTQVS